MKTKEHPCNCCRRETLKVMWQELCMITLAKYLTYTAIVDIMVQLRTMAEFNDLKLWILHQGQYIKLQHLQSCSKPALKTGIPNLRITVILCINIYVPMASNIILLFGCPSTTINLIQDYNCSDSSVQTCSQRIDGARFSSLPSQDSHSITQMVDSVFLDVVVNVTSTTLCLNVTENPFGHHCEQFGWSGLHRHHSVACNSPRCPAI